MVKLSHVTHFGLPGINRVPFGMHVCHPYANREELVAALVPYLVAGLRGKERCLWVTAPPLPASEAVHALRSAWSGVDDAIHGGALRILDFSQWYGNSAGLKERDMVQFWLKEEACALAEGYNGVRIAENTSFLRPGDWSMFLEYERVVTTHIKKTGVFSLCAATRWRSAVIGTAAKSCMRTTGRCSAPTSTGTASRRFNHVPQGRKLRMEELTK